MAAETTRLEGLIAARRADCAVPAPQVAVFARLDSTNAHLLDTADAAPADAPRVCLALQQTAGRGRRGRAWASGPGDGLTLSLDWPLRPGQPVPPGYPVGVGLGLIRALEALGYCGMGLKWPNDLMVGEAKLAGVLVEQRPARAGRPGRLVVGLGLNRARAGGLGLDRAVTDLAALADAEPPDLLQLAAAVAAEQLRRHDTLLAEGLAPFAGELKRLDCLRGGVVEILDSARRVRVRGIDPQSGCLRVEDEQGGLELLHSGEVSVRSRTDA